VDVFTLTCLVASIGITISAAEDVSLPRELFRNSIFDWRYCLAFQRARPERSTPFYDVIFGVDAFRAVAVLKAVSSLVGVVLAWNGHPLAYLPLLVSLACHLFMFYRLSYSVDGADQMMIMVLCGSIAMGLDRGTGCYRDLGASFISLQAALAYITSGATKAFSSPWRSGDGFRGVMSTGTFGNAGILKVLDRHKYIQIAVSRGIFFSQILIGFLILGGSYASIVAIGFALLFHVIVAYLMRLNLFVWGFGATYPSIILMSDWHERTRFVTQCLLQ
jgi:hypothetical protein